MLQDALNDWNPWWKEGKVREELVGMERAQTREIEASLGHREVTVLLGPRRSGKTTVMHQLISSQIAKGTNPAQLFYVNLDDESFTGISLEDIYLTYKKNVNLSQKTYFFIDEIQNAGGWERWLKKMYDRREDVKLMISGSNASLLTGEYSKLITGRMFSFEVLPLSFPEFLRFKGISLPPAPLIGTKEKLQIARALEDFAKNGAYPAAIAKDDYFRKLLLKEYFDGVVYRDIIARFGLDEKKFVEFAHYLATNFTSLLSYRRLMKILRLTYPTLTDYLDHSEKAYLFFQLGYFSYSLAEQTANNKKIYCIDTGMRNAVSFTFSEDFGKLFENIVFIELRRRQAEAYYWADANEVDFVIKNGDNSLTAMNVTYGDEIPERETKALIQFREKFKSNAKELLVLTKEIEQEKDGIKYVPIWKWLLGPLIQTRTALQPRSSASTAHLPGLSPPVSQARPRA